MGISRSNPIPTATPVMPGTTVIQPVYTDGGFTAGDYVYRYAGNKVGAYPYLGASLPGATLYAVIAGTKYALLWGTGAPLTRSNITSPVIAAGTTYTVTLPQTTTLGSSYLAQQVINSNNTSSYFPRCATLTNGNMVVIYYDVISNRLNFKIYNTVGTVINSGVVGSATPTINSPTGGNTGESSWSVCALNSGGFVIFWFPNNLSYSQFYKYDSTGTFITNSSTGGNVGGYIYDVCADASDNIYTLTASGAGGQSLYISKWTSSFAYSANGVVPFGTSAAYFGPARMVATLSGHIAVGFVYSSTAYYSLLTTSLSNVSGATGSFNTTSYCPINVCAALEDNGGAFFSCPYSNFVYVAYSYATSAGGSSGGTTINSVASGESYSSYTSVPCVSSYITTSGVNDGTTNGMVIYYPYGPSPASPIRSMIVTLASNRSTWASSSSVATPFTPYNSSNYGYASVQACTAAAAANFIIGLGNSGTYIPEFAISGTYTYASTSATGSLPAAYATTPSAGYSLIGVAAATVAAGSYGDVVINGTTSIASTYGTSSTPYGFNYNPQNGYGFLGNRGYVVNRIVTLQGLE